MSAKGVDPSSKSPLRGRVRTEIVVKNNFEIKIVKGSIGKFMPNEGCCKSVLRTSRRAEKGNYYPW